VNDLSQPLASILEKAKPSHLNGGATLPNAGLPLTLSTANGASSATTTSERGLAGKTGSEHGTTGALALWNAPPANAKEAKQRAKAMVTHLLPQPVSAFLNAQEETLLRAASTGLKVVQKPNLSPEERTQALTVKASLDRLLTPARNNPKLELEILGLFMSFNMYTGDETKTKLMAAEWADSIEEYPMWAIKQAKTWAKAAYDKLPSISQFRSDVRLAIGTGVLDRKRALEVLLG
jgi:hypothetical protein